MANLICFKKFVQKKKSVQRLLEILSNAYEKYSISEVQIMHGNVYNKAVEVKDKIKVLFPSINTVIGEISSTIAVHAGEGTVALIWDNEPK